MASKTLRLNDGNEIPLLAYGSGTAHMRSKMSRGAKAELADRATVDTIKLAIRAGYRHLDNAEIYGTETEVGEAIMESIKEGVIASRQDLFITSKVGKDPLKAEEAIDACLARLGPDVGYVDLFLIHTPYFTQSNADLQDAWAAMESIHASGKARSIGVSNYEETHLKATLQTAKISPAINQIEFHPYMTTRKGRPVLDQRQLGQTAVSAYGLLSPVTRAIAGPLDAGPLDAVIERLAKIYGVSPGMICLRWAIEQEVVAITTSHKEERMKEYLGVFDFNLRAAEVTEITDAGLACLGDTGELEPRILHYYENLKKEAKSDS